MCPIYSYQCECGVRFEESGRVSGNMNPKPCPACGQDAKRAVPDNMEGIFLQEVSGPVPQNTGISQLDAHIDRVIGKSANAGWKAHSDRVDAKRKVLAENPDASGHDLMESPDGDFEVMPKRKRGFQDRALAINSLAIKSLKQAVPEKDAG